MNIKEYMLNKIENCNHEELMGITLKLLQSIEQYRHIQKDILMKLTTDELMKMEDRSEMTLDDFLKLKDEIEKNANNPTHIHAFKIEQVQQEDPSIKIYSVNNSEAIKNTGVFDDLLNEIGLVWYRLYFKNGFLKYGVFTQDKYYYDTYAEPDVYLLEPLEVAVGLPEMVQKGLKEK